MKKILLGLGSLTVIAMPIVATVSCGKKENLRTHDAEMNAFNIEYGMDSITWNNHISGYELHDSEHYYTNSILHGGKTELKLDFKIPNFISFIAEKSFGEMRILPSNFTLPISIKWLHGFNSLTTLPSNFTLPSSLDKLFGFNSLTTLPSNFTLPSSIRWLHGFKHLIKLPDNFDKTHRFLSISNHWKELGILEMIRM